MTFEQFVDELGLHFRPPDDPDRIIVALAKRLSMVSPDSLQAIADRVIDTHKGRSWPSINEIMDALKAVSGAGQQSVPSASWQARVKRRRVKADDAAEMFMTFSSVAETAREEGWAHDLKVIAGNLAFNSMRESDEPLSLERMEAFLTLDNDLVTAKRHLSRGRGEERRGEERRGEE